ncbi:MAG: type II restriction endonuclease [Ignavibacteriaceae bacterium]|nr:type II restriction endonuclease [Ignavibacteriaceae bacterium]
MNKLCHLLEINEDQLFENLTNGFKKKITTWEYFVDWQKVLKNVSLLETELNILNVLIGEKYFDVKIRELVSKYPEVVKTIPLLLGIRENSLDVLIDHKKFIYKKFDFSKRELSKSEVDGLVEFFLRSGIKGLIEEKRIKNLVDYVMGIEVGLDSNARKNRGGKLMEKITEEFIVEACESLELQYMPQTTPAKIKKEWGIEVLMEKASKTIDFVIKKQKKLYFIECNFYGGGGSKLKSTATEYIEMSKRWKQQNIEFIWITDGEGWKTTLKPLREYFNTGNYLLNLELLKNNILIRILK